METKHKAGCSDAGEGNERDGTALEMQHARQIAAKQAYCRDMERRQPAPGPKDCLILAGNVCVGHQIAALFEAHWEQPHVVHDDRAAYMHITRGTTGIVVADIDTEDLGGLALLAYCHQQYPGMVTYALTPVDSEPHKRLARELGGCRGFFYLENGNLRIDTSRGMAAQLSSGGSPANDLKLPRSVAVAGLQADNQRPMK